MTDRYNSLTVVLEHDIREDDAELLINAIRMIKGVKAVSGNVVDHDSYVVETRIKDALRKKMFEMIKAELT